MALSGSFYNYPVKSFGLYCEWSASQSVTGNYSNVTLKVYLSYWDLYVGARDDGQFKQFFDRSYQRVLERVEKETHSAKDRNSISRRKRQR